MLAIDTAHGHTARVMEAIRAVKRKFPEIQLLAGNVATAEGAHDLISLGVDGLKVGIGPGSICTTRVVTGAGVPQITAIMECSRAAKNSGVPIIADGGIKFSGDITKAIAAGASAVMIGGLFAGTEESPGETILYQGRTFQIVSRNGIDRSDGSGFSGPLFAGRRADRGKSVPEGIEGQVPYKGPLSALGRPARWRGAKRNGILRGCESQRIAGKEPLHSNFIGRPARKPRPRRDHHSRSPELPA